jgi:hypothetical protein
VAAKFKERLAVSRQGAQKFDMERFNLRKQSELEVRKQYQIKVSNRFAALQNLYQNKDILNRAWENNEEYIITSAKKSLGPYELKQNKPWFDEECSQFLDQRERLKCSDYRIQTKAM